MSLEIKGFEEMLRQFRALPAKVEKRILKKATRDAAEVVAESARKKVPVRTGTLKDSINVKSRIKRGKVGAVIETGEGFFKSETFYGAFVELGTNKMPAEPFMRPALIENESTCIDIVGESLASQVTKVALEKS